jgi:stearoyl-CoA desaturase (delta-9 desaturase)
VTLFGFLHSSGLWTYVLYTLIMTHITVISVTLFLHRGQAHRGTDFHPIMSHFFRFWLWLTTGIVTKEWVAIHRKHHTECETENDPHSPQILGLKKVLLEGAELYQEEAKVQETLDRYGRGTPNDWIERNIYSKPKVRSVGIAAMLLINILLFGIPGVAIWAIQMMWIPFFAAGVINGLGHFWGYRNFECPDAARNIIPFGILMGGEELHNNHHTFAASAKLSVKWWELDMGWCYLRLLQLVKLAKVHRAIPKLNENRNKKVVDVDSLRAIVSNRFYVMDAYWREVILPVVKNEKHVFNSHGKHFVRASGKVLIRDKSLIKTDDDTFLQTLLKNSAVCQTVYNFRLKLQEIWHLTNQNQQELLESLHRWCKQAEASGITSLQAFAKRLQYYSSTVGESTS